MHVSQLIRLTLSLHAARVRCHPLPQTALLETLSGAGAACVANLADSLKAGASALRQAAKAL